MRKFTVDFSNLACSGFLRDSISRNAFLHLYELGEQWKRKFFFQVFFILSIEINIKGISVKLIAVNERRFG